MLEMNPSPQLASHLQSHIDVEPSLPVVVFTGHSLQVSAFNSSLKVFSGHLVPCRFNGGRDWRACCVSSVLSKLGEAIGVKPRDKSPSPSMEKIPNRSYIDSSILSISNISSLATGPTTSQLMLIMNDYE